MTLPIVFAGDQSSSLFRGRFIRYSYNWRLPHSEADAGMVGTMRILKHSLKTRTNLLISLFGLLLPLLVPTLSHAQVEEANDPLEPMNRGIFWFNDKLDIYVFEPVARGYDDNLPKPVKTGVSNFFDNLRFPMYLVSDLIQLKFGQAATHTGRFLINSTVGVLGVMDIAKDIDLEPHHEDIGTALGYWGVPGGPYLVLPFFGPSNLRDAVGFAADTALDPMLYYALYGPNNTTTVVVSAGATALNFINRRAQLIEAVETAKEASLDYYLFVRSSYHQIRQNQIYDNNPPAEVDEFGDVIDPDQAEFKAIQAGEAEPVAPMTAEPTEPTNPPKKLKK